MPAHRRWTISQYTWVNSRPHTQAHTPHLRRALARFHQPRRRCIMIPGPELQIGLAVPLSLMISQRLFRAHTLHQHPLHNQVPIKALTPSLQLDRVLKISILNSLPYRRKPVLIRTLNKCPPVSYPTKDPLLPTRSRTSYHPLMVNRSISYHLLMINQSISYHPLMMNQSHEGLPAESIVFINLMNTNCGVWVPRIQCFQVETTWGI